MAELRSTTAIGGNIVWHGGNLRFDPQGETIRYQGHKIYTEHDTPLPGELGNGGTTSAFTKAESDARFAPIAAGGYVKKTGDTMSGKLTNTANEIEINGASPRLLLRDNDNSKNWYIMNSTDSFSIRENDVVTTRFRIDATAADFSVDSIDINMKTALRGFDDWLRINDQNEFASGVYYGSSLLRTDGTLHIGNAGSTMSVNSSAFTYKGNNVFNDAYHPNADKWTSARTLTTTLTGDVSGSASMTIDGSANATVTVTATVANDSHTHDGRYYTEAESDARFANVTGDTFTGNVAISKAGARLSFNETLYATENSGINWITGANQNLELIHEVSDVDINTDGGNGQALIIRDNGPTASIAGLEVQGEIFAKVNQRVFHDAYHPNADKLTTARTISLSGDLSGSVSFDGSSNVTLNASIPSIDNYPTFAEVGLRSSDSDFIATGRTVAGVDSSVDWDTLTTPGFYNKLSQGTNRPSGFTGYWYVQNMSYGTTGNTTQVAYSYGLLGNVGTIAMRTRYSGQWEDWVHMYHTDYHPYADKWTTARSLSLAGELSGSVSIDGSSNVTLNASVDHIDNVLNINRVGESNPSIQLNNDTGETRGKIYWNRVDGSLQFRLNASDGTTAENIMSMYSDRTVFTDAIHTSALLNDANTEQGLLMYSGGTTRLGGSGLGAIYLCPQGVSANASSDFAASLNTSGVMALNASSSTPLSVHRVEESSVPNVNIRFQGKSTDGNALGESWYAGSFTNGAGFGIGTNADLSTASNRLFEVGGAGAVVRREGTGATSLSIQGTDPFLLFDQTDIGKSGYIGMDGSGVDSLYVRTPDDSTRRSIYHEANKPTANDVVNNVISLDGLDSTKFYPVVFDANNTAGYTCEFTLSVGSGQGSSPYNNNTLTGVARGGGWSDHNAYYDLIMQKYVDSETNIHSIWEGTQGFTGVVIYVRGGQRIDLRSNSRAQVYTSDYSFGGSVFPAGISNPLGAATNATMFAYFSQSGRYTSSSATRYKLNTGEMNLASGSNHGLFKIETDANYDSIIRMSEDGAAHGGFIHYLGATTNEFKIGTRQSDVDTTALTIPRGTSNVFVGGNLYANGGTVQLASKINLTYDSTRVLTVYNGNNSKSAWIGCRNSSYAHMETNATNGFYSYSKFNFASDVDVLLNKNILLGGKRAFRNNEGAWLRLNPYADFSSGIYCGSSLLRTDGQITSGSWSGSNKSARVADNFYDSTWGGNGTAAFSVNNPDTVGAHWAFASYYNSSNIRAGIQILSNSDGRMRFYTNRRSNYVEVNAGSLTAQGNVTAYSDARLKENVKIIDNALNKVGELSGYTYDKRKSLDSDEFTRETGVIAQEVQKVLPEAVMESDEDHILSVAYGNMNGLLIEAIKELNEKVDSLQNEVQELKRPWWKKLLRL
ncbi:tail fibers protein [Vibrio phage phi-Grn1]|uniref:Long tail fiber protein Gp37 n=1 Tax=Vibrio phage phi-Grn1 TaxID=1747713 RepID=A0A140B3F5_9CAUD|nr:tail fibers protein [Vibrio phage phi-Grn1]